MFILNHGVASQPKGSPFIWDNGSMGFPIATDTTDADGYVTVGSTLLSLFVDPSYGSDKAEAAFDLSTLDLAGYANAVITYRVSRSSYLSGADFGGRFNNTQFSDGSFGNTVDNSANVRTATTGVWLTHTIPALDRTYLNLALLGNNSSSGGNILVEISKIELT